MNIDNMFARIEKRFGFAGALIASALLGVCAVTLVFAFGFLVFEVSLVFLAVPFLLLGWMVYEALK